MKLFDPRAALAEIEKQAPTPATSATSATQTPKTPPHVANVADVATAPVQIQKMSSSVDPTSASDKNHGFAVNGQPKTWTGNVVSLDEWRRLSEWDKHGPNGRMWCGACQAWVSNCEHISETQGEQ